MLTQMPLDRQLKISIGLRLFFSVLMLTIGMVVAALFLMRNEVADNFSEYTVRIELDRLNEFYLHLQKNYAKQKGWTFLPSLTKQKTTWINQELSSLYLEKQSRSSKPIKLPDIEFDQTNITDQNKAINPIEHPSQIYLPQHSNLPPLPPPAPPAPPAPPSPPAPSEVPELGKSISREVSSLSIPPSMSIVESSLETSDLYQRISLTDAEGGYLAGRPLDKIPRTSRPIVVGNEIVGYLSVTHSSLPSDTMSRDFIEAQSRNIILVLLMSIGFSALAATLLARNFRQPIQLLVDAAKQLEHGEFATRLKETRRDELGALAHSFNHLAQKLENLEVQRRLWVADSSHELRTPVSVIRAQLEAIQDGIRPANAENLALLHRQIMSLNKLIDELYMLAKADLGSLSFHFSECDLDHLINEALLCFQEKITQAGLKFEIDVEENYSFKIHGDEQRLRQILSNLFENSIRYTHAPGKIHARLFHSSNKQIILTIEDTAPAVPSEALGQLADRFYRVENSRNRGSGGAGLGLALCQRIVLAHSGKMAFSHSSLGGLKVEIHFENLTNMKANKS